MLENRSFDHMLGWLQSPEYQIDGLDGTQFNTDSTGAQVFATRDAAYSGDYDPDVAHDFDDVTEQVFGSQMLPPAGPPTMSGFVTDYGTVSGNVSKSHRVMKCFDPSKLPVLSTLAQQYALCTRWFSSVPGPTLPNRAYAHAATSVGHVDMTINWWKESKTIYELLVANNRTAKIYYTDSTIALTFGGMMDRQSEYFVPNFDQFFDDCKNNNLPDYCFLEPRYNATDGDDPEAASDQHPDHDVSEGEQLIQDVFKAIQSNQQMWESTLLVIVYDEHGGLFDHIPPPAAVSPGRYSVRRASLRVRSAGCARARGAGIAFYSGRDDYRYGFRSLVAGRHREEVVSGRRLGEHIPDGARPGGEYIRRSAHACSGASGERSGCDREASGGDGWAYVNACGTRGATGSETFDRSPAKSDAGDAIRRAGERCEHDAEPRLPPYRRS